MAEPRTYILMSEFTGETEDHAKLVAVVSRPPPPLHLVSMAHDLMRPKWYFGQQGREIRSAVVRNVKGEVLRSMSSWIFLKASTQEELQRQGCTRMVEISSSWRTPMWMGVLRQDGKMYRAASVGSPG